MGPVDDTTVQLAVKTALGMMPLLKKHASQLEWGVYACMYVTSEFLWCWFVKMILFSGYFSEAPSYECQISSFANISNFTVAFPGLGPGSSRTAELVGEKVTATIGKAAGSVRLK